MKSVQIGNYNFSYTETINSTFGAYSEGKEVSRFEVRLHVSAVC